jgi:hypothetical protein
MIYEFTEFQCQTSSASLLHEQSQIIKKWNSKDLISKRVLTKHFTKDIDYKIVNFAPQLGGAKKETTGCDIIKFNLIKLN